MGTKGILVRRYKFRVLFIFSIYLSKMSENEPLACLPFHFFLFSATVACPVRPISAGSQEGRKAPLGPLPYLKYKNRFLCVCVCVYAIQIHMRAPISTKLGTGHLWD